MPDRKTIAAIDRLALEAVPSSSSRALTSPDSRPREAKAKTGYITDYAKMKEIAYGERPSLQLDHADSDDILSPPEDSVNSSALASRPRTAELQRQERPTRRRHISATSASRPIPDRKTDDSSGKARAIEYKARSTKHKELTYDPAQQSVPEIDTLGKIQLETQKQIKEATFADTKFHKHKTAESRAIEAPKDRRERKTSEAALVTRAKKAEPPARKKLEATAVPSAKSVSKTKPNPKPKPVEAPEPEPESGSESDLAVEPEAKPSSERKPEPESETAASEDESEDSDPTDTGSELSTDSATRRYHKEMGEYKIRMAQWDKDNEKRRAADAALTTGARSPSPEPWKPRRRSPSPEYRDRELQRRRRSPSPGARDGVLERRRRGEVERSRRYEEDDWSEEEVRTRRQEVVKKDKKKRPKQQSIKINLSNVNNVTM